MAGAAAAVTALACASGGGRVAGPVDPRVAIMGRVDRADPARVRVGYPGVTFRVRFEGPALAGRFSCSNAASRIAVLVDGGAPRVVRLAAGDSQVALAAGLPPGPHVVELVHRTETWEGIVTVRGFDAGPDGRILRADPWPERRLLVIGDSVTCGEAIDRAADCRDAHDAAATSNGYLAYGMLLGRTFGAQVHLVCYGGRGLVRDWRGKTNVLNGPQLFDASLPVDLHPAPWDHAGYVPEVVIVALGTNDFNLDLGALPDREAYVAAYVAFIRSIRARYPAAHVVLTEGAIVNDEKDPARPQKTVLRQYLAETVARLGDARVEVVPATHYPGDACNAHPTRAQHEAIARDLEPVIRRLTGW
jgi:lysophospholipase L1-like esterase